MQKQLFKHFSRGLQGVGDLLFFIKHGIYRAVSMHFSNNCMHAPYIVRMARQTEMNQWQLRAPINFEFLSRANYFHINWTKIWNSTDAMHVVSLFCLLSHRLLGKSFFILPPFVNSPENLLRRKLLFEGYMAAGA